MDMLHKSIRLSFAALCLLVAGGLFGSHALAQDFRVVVKKIGPNMATGDVIVQVKPGAKEKGFSGKANVMLAGSDAGTNRAMAILLTAITMGAEVRITTPGTPSSSATQIITDLRLVAP